METAELLKKVRKIEIKTRGMSRHLFSGGYHSAFKGRGMSFSEVRQYQVGDDVRAIDWNVTARTGEPHIKIFEEERELSVMLLVDVSGSAFFGTQGQSKQDMLTEICAILAFSADSNNDKVGLMLFADQPLLFIPPKKGRQHMLRIIRELLNLQPNTRGTQLGAALGYAHNLLKKRSICFLLSDFLSEADYDAPLRVMARQHDLIGIQAWDLRERSLPDVGLLPVRDAETGSLAWLDTTDPDLRRRYQQRFDERQAQLAGRFRRAGADFLSLQTTENYEKTLLRFFERRIVVRK
jgi:uncharacterized protein (DUF58 family)